MRRYFFNVHCVDGIDLHDDVGVRLGSRADIHKHIVSMAIDLVDGMRSNDPPRLVEVLDEAGEIVCSMDIGIENEFVLRPVANGTIFDVRKGGLPTIRSLLSAISEPSSLSSDQNMANENEPPASFAKRAKRRNGDLS